MIRLRSLLLPLLAACALTACSEDNPPIAPYTQGLVEVVTDATGHAVRLIPDDGHSLTIDNAGSWPDLTADSLYRAQALYVVTPTRAEVHGLEAVISPMPDAFHDVPVRTDPVAVKAVWRGGRYANLHISIPTGGGGHRFGFIERGIATKEDGHKVLTIDLHHDQSGDAAHYHRDVLLSCPLYGYTADLRPGTDSVLLRINTDRGTFEKSLPY